MDLGLSGRRVLVTGGSSGIGEATARAFAAEGARVALTYRDGAKRAGLLAEELGGGEGRALALPYDLGMPETVEAVVGAVEEHWGGVDVLVANALRRAARRSPGSHLEDVPAQELGALLEDNLGRTLRTAQLVLPGMRARGWGRIGLVSSHIARDGAPGQEIYAAGKAALHGFARSLSWDAAPDGVLVNVVSPGLTRTAGVLTDLPVGIRDREQARTPTGRLSAPEDVARALVFLCSAANDNITGSVLDVSGGR
ncbi:MULTISPECIES: SDR family oxidoreductase [unclassified Streptomyces]|uniref:SDR family NAD(P)-dependent oxidoreductase n=1 Tax=unclassified Streptomyces TaxID=2593676 RepID=UPI0024A8540D|nr:MULTISPECIES: SDR family oxidoreductase [unclassified Streptomyces]